MDLTRKVDVRAFTLANPYRVVIDLPQVTFQLPRQDRRAPAAGLIKAFRFGLVMQGGSRMVMDLTGEAGPNRQGLRPGQANEPAGAARRSTSQDRPRQPSCGAWRSARPCCAGR